MAIAEHQPGKLFKRNKGLKKMSHSQLHDFASTKGAKSSKKDMKRRLSSAGKKRTLLKR